jgi:hypothetical protein
VKVERGDRREVREIETERAWECSRLGHAVLLEFGMDVGVGGTATRYEILR